MRFIIIASAVVLIFPPKVILGFETGEAADQAVIDSLIRISINESIEHNYACAESAAEEMIKIAPKSPAGYFYRAGVVNSMMLDYEDNFREDDFYNYLDRTIELSEKMIRADADNPWGHFYLGGASGYLALHHTCNGRFFSALGHGLKAVKELDKTMQLDSTLYDAYLGIGNYKYWLSRRTEFLRWLPFIKDRREEGIKMIYTAMERGEFSRDTAASSLAWVLIDAGRYQHAYKTAEEALKRHPDSRFFLFASGRSLFELGRYEEAIVVYEKLLSSIRSLERNNHFNEISVLDKLAEAYYLKGNYQMCFEYAKAGLALPLDAEMRKTKAVPLKRMETLKAKSLDRLMLEQ
ncbi:tetratricopeptide repeat protein [bacterium]|nr:tetratricopeptide repeat protein [FCB group bacterium]MBL7191600.1 tetratricopeptide repeat protein [bacterium]